MACGFGAFSHMIALGSQIDSENREIETLSSQE